MYNVDGRHSAWMFYIAKCIWGGLLASICAVNTSWRWGDKNWYLKSIHSSFINFPHPSATHCTLSPCFCTKTFIRSYRLPSLVIELNTTMHNGNASYELQNVCLFHLVKFVYILHLQLLFGSSIFMLFCIFYSGTVA